MMKLKNDEGVWMEWGNRLKDLMVGYFKNLFTTSGCTTDPILRSVHRRVTDEQNQMLTKVFEVREIKEVVWHEPSFISK